MDKNNVVKPKCDYLHETIKTTKQFELKPDNIEGLIDSSENGIKIKYFHERNVRYTPGAEGLCSSDSSNIKNLSIEYGYCGFNSFFFIRGTKKDSQNNITWDSGITNGNITKSDNPYNPNGNGMTSEMFDYLQQQLTEEMLEVIPDKKVIVKDNNQVGK